MDITFSDLPKKFYTDNLFNYALASDTGAGEVINIEEKLV